MEDMPDQTRSGPAVNKAELLYMPLHTCIYILQDHRSVHHTYSLKNLNFKGLISEVFQRMQAAEQLSSETFRYYMSENTDHHQFSKMINLKKKKKQKNIILDLPQAVSPPPLHHHHHHHPQFYSYGK